MSFPRKRESSSAAVFESTRPMEALVGKIVPYIFVGYVQVGGILLKGNGLAEIAPQLWPIALFGSLAIFLGVKRYRRTLD